MRTTDTHVYFYSGPDIYSNFHQRSGRPHQFKDPLNGDLAFYSTEQAFMWWKAVFFQDSKVATLLEAEANPGMAKSLGRQIARYDDRAWECVRLGFMTYVNLLKFSQNEDWAAQLKATGDRIIVEASVPDRIWGVGLDENDPLILDSVNWRGRNLLGEALMTVRGLL